MTFATGGCLCGALRYSLLAAPERVTICYCRFCQRATGSDRLVEPIFALDDVKIEGEAQVYTLPSEGSGLDVHVHFCATCGTKIGLTFARWPEIFGLYRGTMDDPGRIVPDPARDKVIFTSEALPGALIPAHYPTFDRHASEPDGTPNAPTHPAACREV